MANITVKYEQIFSVNVWHFPQNVDNYDIFYTFFWPTLEKNLKALSREFITFWIYQVVGEFQFTAFKYFLKNILSSIFPLSLWGHLKTMPATEGGRGFGKLRQWLRKGGVGRLSKRGGRGDTPQHFDCWTQNCKI